MPRGRRLTAGLVAVCLASGVLAAVAAPAAGEGPADSAAIGSGLDLPAGGAGAGDSQLGGGPEVEGGPELGGGLEGGEELEGGPEQGPAAGEGVVDVLGDDGVYEWVDGDRSVSVRPLAGGPGAVEGASAFARQSGGLTNSTQGQWFVTDTGQELQLFGGVIVIFREGTSPAAVEAVWGRHGISISNVRPLDGLASGFVVDASPQESLKLAAALAGEPVVVAASPNWLSPVEADWSGSGSPQDGVDGGDGGDVAASISTGQRNYCKGLAPRRDWKWADELHLCAWHLDADTGFRGSQGSGVDPSIDINIGDVWDTTKGEGVTVAIVDHHWNGGHEDLRDNVDAARSTDWGGWTNEPFVTLIGVGPVRIGYWASHGTQVAGVVGGRDNTVGSRGVAPRASLVNFNFLDDQTLARSIESYTGHSDVVGVSNHSYGTNRAGLIRRPGVWWAAADAVLARGLGGKGTLFTKAVGNEAGFLPHLGNTAYNEHNNHRGVMPVCAVGADGEKASYSNEGPNLWVCAPSNGSRSGVGIITTQGANQYTDRFGGTSAAAPEVAGVVALVRSANQNLTWRDVKLILADTARKIDPTDSSWQTGAAKHSDSAASYSYSRKYGFGLADAKAAVQKALSWTLLPDEKLSTATSSGPDVVLKNDKRTTELTLSVSTGIDFTEHVNLDLDMSSGNFREFDITLVSPTGRESVISAHASRCSRGCDVDGMFRFATARHLGEDPNGVWKLRFDYRGRLEAIPALAYDKATVKSWALKIYGHTAAEATPTPWLSLAVGAANAVEATVKEGHSLQVTATLHNGTLTSDLVLPIEFVKQSANNDSDSDEDFIAPPTVTIPAGSTSAAATFTVKIDGLGEGTEKFAVRFGTLPAGYDAVGVTPTINIEDSPKLIIIGGSDIDEGGDAVFTVRSYPAPTAAFDVDVAIDVDGDFGVVTGKRTVTVPTSSGGWFSEVSFSVSTVDDGVSEPDGTVWAVLDLPPPGSAYGVGIPRSAWVVVSDYTPVVSILAGDDVVEGGDGVFTVLVRRAPPADFDVGVTVTASGDFGAVTGKRTVTVPTSGELSFAVGTVYDGVPEPDGSVSVSLVPDSRYHTGYRRLASVAVADYKPVVSISAGDDVFEGGDAVFTVSADPAPAADFDVSVNVAATGDFGAAVGSRTVTVPASGSASFAVGTVDDDVFEADGSVTASLVPESRYSVGAPGSGSVDVIDGEGVTVSLSASPGSVAEANGKAAVAVSLGRPLVNSQQESQWVRVPLAVSGGIEGTHWKLGLAPGGNP
ncbi:MAG: S8 family serine peptidase, partial [bacterium]|nr:S8 family serine peptidase [bacterium]